MKNETKKNTFTLVYDEVKKIPKGKVTTYGYIAFLIGNPRLSRVVGFALHANPDPEHILCHRVVNRFGGLSQSFVFGGANVQRALLEEEGISFLENGNVNIDAHMWNGEHM